MLSVERRGGLTAGRHSDEKCVFLREYDYGLQVYTSPHLLLLGMSYFLKLYEKSGEFVIGPNDFVYGILEIVELKNWLQQVMIL